MLFFLGVNYILNTLTFYKAMMDEGEGGRGT